jgi:hypothetical protein
MESLKYLCKARSSVRGHIEKAHPKFIGLDPAHDRLLDRHGLRLVGKPELQPQTRPTGAGGRAFNPTALEGQIQEHPLALPLSMSIFHPPVRHDTSTNSFGHRLTPFAEDSD